MDESEPDRCASCGARNPGAAGGGTLHVVATNDLAAVEQVMRGGLDKVRCAACNTPLAVTTTIAVVSPLGRRAVMTVSDLAPAELDIAGTIRSDMADQGIELTPVSSADEVRDWLLELWTQRLPADVMEALQADTDRRSVIIGADPDRFDPEALIGAALIAVYSPDGAPFAIADDADPAEAVDLIAAVQARTLLALVLQP